MIQQSMEYRILVKYRRVGGVAALNPPLTGMRESPKMSTVLAEGDGKAVGREETRRDKKRREEKSHHGWFTL